jgi:hypothetical protein
MWQNYMHSISEIKKTFFGESLTCINALKLRNIFVTYNIILEKLTNNTSL